MFIDSIIYFSNLWASDFKIKTLKPTEINKQGLGIVKFFEGFSSEPYLCPSLVPTIGYGSTFYENGVRVSLNDTPVTEARALDLLEHELGAACNYVNNLVNVSMNENQFSALVSLTYNIGAGNFKGSTLRSKLNREDYEGAANEFWKWRRGGGVILQGLVKRRAMEESLFNSPV